MLPKYKQHTAKAKRTHPRHKYSPALNVFSPYLLQMTALQHSFGPEMTLTKAATSKSKEITPQVPAPLESISPLQNLSCCFLPYIFDSPTAAKHKLSIPKTTDKYWNLRLGRMSKEALTSESSLSSCRKQNRTNKRKVSEKSIPRPFYRKDYVLETQLVLLVEYLASQGRRRGEREREKERKVSSSCVCVYLICSACVLCWFNLPAR